MNASCSMLSQILKLIPRIEFERIVKATNAEHRSKGFTSWGQFVAMLFCQLGRAHSLREIEGGLKSCEGKLSHLGIEAPARSTLAYANAHRPWQLFEKVFYELYVKVAQQIHFAPGTIVVDDRGYNDYRRFANWTGAGVFFVTRMKGNALYEVTQTHKLPANMNILSDQTIRLTGAGAADKCPDLLRRIEVLREDTGTTLVFLTNHFKLSATTVAAIYKDRWQIELFFKALKQNLKIKTFVGTSANPVRTQIWVALIAMPLLRFLQQSSTFGWSLSNLVALLRMNLFTHRDLMAWLMQPFAAPPDPPASPPQAALALA